VNVGEGAVLALGSVATHNLEPWTVYGGVPAKPLKKRVMRQDESEFAGVTLAGVKASGFVST
jgi:acetyltransferase-like isoleucine patch superfamily enzyme